MWPEQDVKPFLEVSRLKSVITLPLKGEKWWTIREWWIKVWMFQHDGKGQWWCLTTSLLGSSVHPLLLLDKVMNFLNFTPKKKFISYISWKWISNHVFPNFPLINYIVEFCKKKKIIDLKISVCWAVKGNNKIKVSQWWMCVRIDDYDCSQLSKLKLSLNTFRMIYHHPHHCPNRLGLTLITPEKKEEKVKEGNRKNTIREKWRMIQLKIFRNC